MAGDTGRATLAEGTSARRRAPGGRRCVADRGLSSCLARQLRSAGLHGAVGAPACARGTAPQGGWCSVAPFSSSSRWAHAAGVRTHARCANPTLRSRRSPHEVRRFSQPSCADAAATATRPAPIPTATTNTVGGQPTSATAGRTDWRKMCGKCGAGRVANGATRVGPYSVLSLPCPERGVAAYSAQAVH